MRQDRTADNSNNSRTCFSIFCSVLTEGAGQLLKMASTAINFLSISRAFTGGANFAARIFPHLTPGQLLIPATIIGAFSSRSPFLQCRNSIEKITKLWRKPRGFAYFMAFSPLGGAAGFSFAEMTYTAIIAFIVPWGNNLSSETNHNIAFFFAVATFLANSWLYTEKLASLAYANQLGSRTLNLLRISKRWICGPERSCDIKCEIKPKKILKNVSLTVNLVLATLACSTNYQYGKQLCEKITTNAVAEVSFGIASTFGIVIMTFTDSTLTVIKIMEHFTKSKTLPIHSTNGNTTPLLPESKTRESVSFRGSSFITNGSFEAQNHINDDKFQTQENHQVALVINHPASPPQSSAHDSHFSFYELGWWETLGCGWWAGFAALPNTEYNFTVNLSGNITAFSWFLFLIAIPYNVIPKFISSAETKYQELQDQRLEEAKNPVRFTLSSQGARWLGLNTSRAQGEASFSTTLTT